MSETQALYVLLAPTGQLTGNGQLRETIRERRKRNGDDVAFWYLSPELVQKSASYTHLTLPTNREV